MIPYSTGQWSIQFLFQLRGSVFPKALVWAFPAAGNAVFLHWFWIDKEIIPDWETGSGVGAVWSSFTFVLGFLLVFRTQSAYSRYWEGATLVQQARASFFNCCSSLIAFSSADTNLRGKVDEFQHLLVRLMSMLHCVGLQTVAEMSDVKFEFFNTDGMDSSSLKFLSMNTDKHQRCEIVVQWIQRLIIDAEKQQILDVAAPILTRVFQELAQGAAFIINARIMTGIPFPFPYAQLLTSLLFVHWALTPFFAAVVMRSALWSSIFSFISVFAFWGVNYIAAEIEAPFGNDPNDLPLHELQKDMNKSLWILLHPNSQCVPTFKFDPDKHRRWDIICKDNFHKVDATARENVRGILMTGRSRIWAMASRSGDPFPQLQSLSSGFFTKIQSKVSSTAMHSMGSTYSVYESSRFDAGEGEIPPRVSIGAEGSSSQHSCGSHPQSFDGVLLNQGSMIIGEPRQPNCKPHKPDSLNNSLTCDSYQHRDSPTAAKQPVTPVGAAEIPACHCLDALQEFLENHVSRTMQDLVRLQETMAGKKNTIPSDTFGPLPTEADYDISGLQERIGTIPQSIRPHVQPHKPLTLSRQSRVHKPTRNSVVSFAGVDLSS